MSGLSKGLLVGVVGPSGVGKDSVMEAMAAAREDVFLVRRAITRSEHLGGEAFDGVTEEQFDVMIEDDAFALHWPAHGMRYGVPWSELQRLQKGGIGLVNLSRATLAKAEAQFDRFVTLHLSAPKEVLAQRLSARGRESEDEIEERLARAKFSLPAGITRVIGVSNTGTLEDTARAAFAALDQAQPESA
ncbi:MAG: phosphonate metabolism protein/1,5-bisphosphokinase (PRPP-forming) PhnN [Pseudomonadota bacterium]